MEPRAVVVEPLTEGDEYTVYSATQIPHILRVMLALTTGIPEHKLRVDRPGRRRRLRLEAATSTPRRSSRWCWPASWAGR